MNAFLVAADSPDRPTRRDIVTGNTNDNAEETFQKMAAKKQPFNGLLWVSLYNDDRGLVAMYKAETQQQQENVKPMKGKY